MSYQSYGNIEIVKFLLEKGAANFYIRNKNFYYDPMYWACDYGNFKIAKLLATHGFKVCMFAACMGGNLEIVKFFWDEDAVPFKINLLLFHTSKCGHLEIAKFLVDKGADIHSFQGSIIENAEVGGHDELVSFLKSVL